jgi:3-oxoacyl-[acyl-carrier-protein] synthase III
MKPWSGDFTVKSPVMVEAKIIEAESKPEVDVKISDPKENKKQTKSKVNVVKEKKEVKPKIDLSKVEITKEMILRFMEKNGTVNEEVKNVLYEQASLKLGDNPKDLLKFFITFYKKNRDKLKGK